MKSMALQVLIVSIAVMATGCGKEGDVGPFGNMKGPSKPDWVKNAEQNKLDNKAKEDTAPEGVKSAE